MNYINGISMLFIATTIITVVLFYLTTQRHKPSLILILVFALIQGLLGWQEFFIDFEAMPPRVTLLLPPAIVIMFFAFYSRSGKLLIEKMDLKMLTLLSVIRIPIEIVLLQLFIQGLLPESMTFEGRNFDILSGISAPVIWFFAFREGKVNRKLLLIWNLISFSLLIQVVVTAIFSFPSPIQMQAFNQPAVGVLDFPFVWLPGIVVPIVAFSHVVSIHKLIKMVNN